MEQNGKTIHGTVPDLTGSFGFNKIPKVNYSLVISQLGFRNFVADSLIIIKDTIINLNIACPSPCPKPMSKDKNQNV